MEPSTTPNTRSEEEADEISERNSEESPFLRLPGEIRNRIYEFAFGDHIIEIDNTAWDENDEPVFRHYCSTDGLEETPYTFFDLLNMTTTCRQFFLETFTLPLSENKFKMSSRTPLDLAKHVSAWQIRAIKTIEIRFWRSEDFARDWYWDGYEWSVYTGVSHVFVPVMGLGVVRKDGYVDFNEEEVCEILRGTFGEDLRVSFDINNLGFR